ncbi:hypothetical protein QL285_048836 [Trifolium repens]|nr:hypothetical protein QL285_048836 [Trifolium repens]
MNEDNCSSNKDRYDILYQKAVQLLEEGSLTDESCNFACQSMEEALKHCALINQSLKVSRENVGKNILLDRKLLDPKTASTKGAPKRLKSGIEKGRKRACSGRVKKSAFVEKEAVISSDVINDEVAASTTMVKK